MIHTCIMDKRWWEDREISWMSYRVLRTAETGIWNPLCDLIGDFKFLIRRCIT